MVEEFSLYVGIIFCALGILMRVEKLDFIIARYEVFHKAIRKKNSPLRRKD